MIHYSRNFDWTTYVSANFLPVEVRQDYYNLTWFYHEITRAVENTREVDLGMGKIKFWRDSIERLYDDDPIKEPVSICLHHTCKTNPIPKQLLLKLTDAKVCYMMGRLSQAIAYYVNIFYRFKLLRYDLTIKLKLTVSPQFYQGIWA